MRTLSFGTKEKKRKRENKAGSTLVLARRRADEGSVQRVKLPHPGRVVAGSGRRPGAANFPGFPFLWLKCVGFEGEFGRSLVCIGSVLSLAVVPTALQKLHKCVTQNTTELWDMLTH